MDSSYFLWLVIEGFVCLGNLGVFTAVSRILSTWCSPVRWPLLSFSETFEITWKACSFTSSKLCEIPTCGLSIVVGCGYGFCRSALSTVLLALQYPIHNTTGKGISIDKYPTDLRPQEECDLCKWVQFILKFAVHLSATDVAFSIEWQVKKVTGR